MAQPDPAGGEVRLDMLAMDGARRRRHALRRQIGDQVVERVEVDPGGLGRPGGIEVERKRLAQAGERVGNVRADRGGGHGRALSVSWTVVQRAKQ